MGILLLIAIIIHNNNRLINYFSIEEYATEMQQFPSSASFDDVSSATKARLCASQLWVQLYGVSVLREIPYQVSFDPHNDVWLVKGSISGKSFGGTAMILISRSSGDVIAVWHDR